MSEGKLGQCIICGERVFTEERYITSTDGYCHNTCLTETTTVA